MSITCYVISGIEIVDPGNTVTEIIRLYGSRPTVSSCENHTDPLHGQNHDWLNRLVFIDSCDTRRDYTHKYPNGKRCMDPAFISMERMLRRMNGYAETRTASLVLSDEHGVYYKTHIASFPEYTRYTTEQLGGKCGYDSINIRTELVRTDAKYLGDTMYLLDKLAEEDWEYFRYNM